MNGARWTRAEGLDFKDVPECSVLKGIRVVAVENHPVPKEAVLAYDALTRRAPSRAISLRVADQKAPLRLACGPEVHAPPFKRLLR